MLADLKKDGLYVGIHENNLVVDISEDDMIRLFRKHKKRKHRNMKEVEFFFQCFY